MRILIIDKPRERSPLLTLFYKELEKDGHYWHWDVDNKDITSLLGLIPYITHIYWGFTYGTALKYNADLIKERNIKIIYDPGDLSELAAGHRPIVDNLTRVDFLIARWPQTKGYDPVPEGYKDVPLIHIPWAVGGDYKDLGWERRIDVAMMSTVADWDYHSDRKVAIESLRTVHCRKVIDNWWDKEYRDILRSTKMFVVDPSKRDFPVQKYFEAPACGAAIIGKIPTSLKDIFEHDISCIELEDYSGLGPKVVKYLQRPDDLMRIAQEGKKRVANFTLDKSVELLYNGLKCRSYL